MPVAVLILQKVGPWTAWVKENEASCMIAVYAITALAMIVGSLLKPQPQGSSGRRQTMTAIIDGILTMLKDHWFWGATTLVCLAWYSTVTVYVAIKGAADIRNMLRRLSDGKPPSQEPSVQVREQ